VLLKSELQSPAGRFGLSVVIYSRLLIGPATVESSHFTVQLVVARLRASIDLYGEFVPATPYRAAGKNGVVYETVMQVRGSLRSCAPGASHLGARLTDAVLLLYLLQNRAIAKSDKMAEQARREQAAMPGVGVSGLDTQNWCCTGVSSATTGRWFSSHSRSLPRDFAVQAHRRTAAWAKARIVVRLSAACS
jgi:hypothetical protein